MKLTVEALLAFDPTHWRAAAEALSAVARGTQGTGGLLDEVAVRMGTAWSDEVGAMIVARCRAHAEAVMGLAEVLAPLADTLHAGADAMSACADELRALLAVEPSAQADSHAFTADPQTLARADAVRSVTASILQRATVVDRRVAAALTGTLRLETPTQDLGPLDLSGEGLALAADLTTQGPTGLDAWTATLMSLGRSDPAAVNADLAWDEERQAYRVRLFDPGTDRPVEEIVDPQGLPEFPSNAMTQAPDFVAVLTQALRQRHPDLDVPDAPAAAWMLLGVEASQLCDDEVSFSEILERAGAERPDAVIISTKSTPGQAGEHWSVAGVTSDGSLVLRHPNGPGYPHPVRTLDEGAYRRIVDGVVILPHSGGGGAR